MSTWHSIEELTPRNVVLHVGWHKIEKDTFMNSGADTYWHFWQQSLAMLTDKGWRDEIGNVLPVTWWRE